MSPDSKDIEFIDRPEEVEFTDRDEVIFTDREENSTMAVVIKKQIQWDPSASPDAVKHRVYIVPQGTTLDYTSPMVEVDMPKVTLDIPDEFPGFPQLDTVYQIGVTSVDDAGNESSMEIITAPFDFDAPDAPTNVRVVAI
jgi:hypothetical protein